MKSLVPLATLLLSLTASAGEQWSSPDKFYSITPPSGWSQREDAPGGHRSFAFISPDRKAEIRISATYDLVRLPKDLPDEILDAFFPDERGVAPTQRVRGAGWDGLRREYTNADKSTRWLGIAASRGSTVVVLTMSAPSADFERLRPIFESVSHSLELGQTSPEKHIVPDKQIDEFIQLALTGFWGKAVDENDHPIQPKDELDRKTVPIPIADARRVAHAGVPAGFAAWADLDWESYYKAFMKKERSSGRWSGKQIAFIGILFGVAQGSIEKSLEDTPRDKMARDRAAEILADARSAL